MPFSSAERPGIAKASSRGSAKRRRVSWDLLRVGAVLLVLVFHGTFLARRWHPELVARPFVFPYQLGASLLLVISGYFAALSLRKGDVVRWWVGRMARMLPAFLVGVLGTSLFLRLCAPPGWYAPGLGDVLANLAMLWNWKPQTYTYVDAAYWTIPLQLLWFTAILALWRSRRIHGDATVRALWLVLGAELFLLPIRLHLESEAFRTLYDGFGLYRVHLFIAGIAVHLWARRRVHGTHAALLLGACVLIHWCQTRHMSWTVGLAVGIAVICAAALGPDWDRVVPGWVGRALEWAAGITYAVYLVHQSIGYVVMRRLQDHGVGALGQLAAMGAVAILLGWALTALVERPAHRAIMRGFDHLRPARVSA
ncbi:acyltransferase family protein [Embleya sp. NBC_00896]|uniref:acyltransferase family protein n=1 Tax=Embleya sp. NBC_00896 TaxID=2975961 RepID=UPI00386A6407|nr:acyltransferase [Embleya sp. NBC_00896]